MARNSSAASPLALGPSEILSLKRKSNDIGWEYGILVDPTNMDKVKCILCGKVVSGGIYRLKQHIGNISGNVAKCPNASPQDQAKCKNSINEAKNKKKNKRIEEYLFKDEVNIDKGVDDDEALQEIGSSECHTLGPIDKLQQQNVSEAILEESTHAVKQYVARWVYEHGIPFSAINSDSFKMMVEAIGRAGPDFVPPTQYELRGPLLKEDVERTKALLKKHEEERAMTGCSIMIDAWTDRKRSIMNLCVNCKVGTCFLFLKESSYGSQTSQLIFEHVDNCIEQVGPEHVVQVVTSNATSNMGAARIMKEKRPNIFWSSCASHTINLMLEAIGKLAKFKKIIDQAKVFTIFIYSHHKTLALMRLFTKRRDIVRPGVTRFDSTFLTLQSLMVKKAQLRAMVGSIEWDNCKWSKTAKGKVVSSTMMSVSFWNGVSLCLMVFAPLVKVLRMVDGDSKPSMGFLYGELLQAKKEIKEAMNNLEINYKPILEIIDSRIKDRLDSPLHLAAYMLNPYYSYRDPTIHSDNTIMDGVFACVDVFYHEEYDTQNSLINRELPEYREKQGAFVAWWKTYGCHTPILQRLAVRILSLTTRSSGCVRNWSTFKWIHTKEKNRLDVSRLNNLAYIQFNAKLMNKQEREKEKNVDVLLDSDDTHAQGWTVDMDDDDDEKVERSAGLTWRLVDVASGASNILQPRRSDRARELHEDDFESNDSEEDVKEEEDEFESDQEQAMQGSERSNI